jgi:cell division protein FtsI (penicillin-binding protein 3)
MSEQRQRRLRRTMALAAVVVVGGACMLRLVDIQVVQAAQLSEEAHGKRAVPVVIPSVRGDIVDRNGAVLATTDERFDVQLSPKNTKLGGGTFPRLLEQGSIETVDVSAKRAFAEIGAITGQSAAEIQEIVDQALEENPKSDFAYVKRSIDLSALNQLKALGIPWLTFGYDSSRNYPSGAVGGNLIGFVGTENEAQSGIELSQDACVVGSDGSESYERSADGVALPGSMVVRERAVNGGTVGLTIDRDLQWQAQQAINGQVQSVTAEWGLLAIMDVRTGELVAVAEDGSVDPNDVDASDPTKREARSFVAPYEPGSTFKTITAATLIDTGAATPQSAQLTPSTLAPETGVIFNDSFVHAPEPWTLTGILVHSSNVGISLLGSRVDPQTRYDYMQKFGFGVSTDSGLPLEDSGMLAAPENWDAQTKYNTMFGQGLSSTIVQMAGAFQAIANDGERIPPSLVRSCISAEGDETIIEHGDPVRAISAESSREVIHMLEAVVNESWITPFVEIPGYRIAGKTGTAEQADGQGGYRADYVHSFAGIFPADDPQYVAVASIAFPSTGDGGVAALTAFREAAEATIRAFHIPPSTGAYEPLPTTY